MSTTLQVGRVCLHIGWAAPERFGSAYRGDVGVEVKFGYFMFWLGKQGTQRKRWEYPVGGDMLMLSTRIDTHKFKFRFHFCVGVDGWFERPVEKQIEIVTTQQLGTMGSNPTTGECFAAYIGLPLPAEFAELMRHGALVERSELTAIKDAFCEVRPSRQILKVGPLIGKHLGCDISEWHERADGVRYHYVGVCGQQPNLNDLAIGQAILAPGLIYQRN